MVVANIYFVTQFVLLKLELQDTQKLIKVQETNEKVLFFSHLFVDKVLSASGEVNFEDRLKLENAVRDINDQNILSRWQKFTNSKTDTEAQREAGQLFSALLDKFLQ